MGLLLLFKKRITLRLAGGLGDGVDVDAATVAVEPDVALGQGEQGPVAPDADIAAGREPRTALANNDAAGSDEFTTKSFHTESFADAIASVA